MDGYKVAVLLNLALCDMALHEHAQAIAWCDKAISYDEKNAKAWFRCVRCGGISASVCTPRWGRSPSTRRA